jgi:hypothetical protein
MTILRTYFLSSWTSDLQPPVLSAAALALSSMLAANQANIYPVVAGTARYALLQVVGNCRGSMVTQRISRT